MKNNHGGKRVNAGRKTKADEGSLIESLDRLINSDEVILKLKNLIENDNFPAIKEYLNRRHGKVKEVVENRNITNDFDIKDIFCFEDSNKNAPENLEPIEWVE